MAIKMRILYAASGKMATLAAKLHAEYQLGPNAVDNIPPAYSCDKERIVFLGLSVKDEPDDSVKRFLGELNPSRAQNVALMMINSTEAGANFVKKILKDAGTNVHEEVFFVKGSFLPFLKSVKPEEEAALIEWSHKVVESLK
jgi:hypothetical protein